jgi:truncated hemoglobin YjbI
MHWYIEFRDPLPDPDRKPSLFEWAGGLPALTRMTRLFYEKHIPADPQLAPIFADAPSDQPQRVALWLAEVFGGPTAYSNEYGGNARMVAHHAGKSLTEDLRARWVALLCKSATEAGLPNDAEFQSAFRSYLEWGSRVAVENSQRAEPRGPETPMPRWDWTTGVGPPAAKTLVTATQTGTSETAVVLPAAGQPISFERHVKTLFRPRDRQSMQFAFDLWSYDDVAAHADDVLARVSAGTMPCDGAWPKERIDAFKNWVDAGKPR